jgi:hypothetical protein
MPCITGRVDESVMRRDVDVTKVLDTRRPTRRVGDAKANDNSDVNFGGNATM